MGSDLGWGATCPTDRADIAGMLPLHTRTNRHQRMHSLANGGREMHQCNWRQRNAAMH